jgi:hypothetical protein
MTLRDREDAKIGSEVDQQIERACHQLDKARQLMAEQKFIAAMEAQTATRHLASVAYAIANEQVREINQRRANLAKVSQQARKKVEQCMSEARQLPPVAQTESTNRLGRQLRDSLSKAEQAYATTTDLEDYVLAEALQAARNAFDEVNQLAEWMTRQVAADREEYKECLTSASDAVSKAQEAIQQAQRVVRLSGDPSGVAKHALERAQAALPLVDSTQNATEEALIRIRQQANEADLYARQAESLARREIRQMEARREHLQQPERDAEGRSRLARLSDQLERDSEQSRAGQ